jgi:hypothetical protein
VCDGTPTGPVLGPLHLNHTTDHAPSSPSNALHALCFAGRVHHISYHIGLLVGLPAVAADLAVGPRERADVPHLNHGRDEVAREGAAVSRVMRRHAVHGAVAGAEELLVGVEQAEPHLQVPEVGVVERDRAPRVQGHQVAVAPLRRADLPPPRREPGVDVGVVVDAGAEARAPGGPDGVRAGEGDEVAGVQALGRERGHQGRRAGGRRREVAVRCCLARRARVAAAQRHSPRRTAQLRTLCHCFTVRQSRRQ